MRPFAPNRLRVFLLAVYIPLSVSVGLMHSDELLCLGTGHLAVGNPAAQSVTRAVNGGSCLACLFTAGHIVNDEPFIPVLSPDRAANLTEILISSESFPQTHSARAPPAYPLQ